MLQSNLTTTYYNHAVPKQTVSRTIKYRVVTKTSYGTTAYKDTATQTLHYYNIPTITIGTITRTSTAATVNITVTSKTSLSGVTTVGTWTCYNKGTSTSVSTGNLGTSQAAQNISVTSLTESGQYDLKIIYKDNTVFSSNVTTSAISIGQMLPAFFVNKYGIGVGGAFATSSNALNVTGNITATGALQKAGTSQSWLNGAKGVGVLLNMTSQDGYSPIIRQKTTNGAWALGVYSNDAFYLTYLTDTDISAGNNTASAQFIFPSNVRGTVYSTGNKPSKSDVGLGNVNN